MYPDLISTRKKIADLGLLMFNRRLTDSAGGNISVRVGDLICITPRYAGAKFRWELQPEQVLVCDRQGNKLDGDGDISREGKVHLTLLNEFPDHLAVVHGHAQNALVFCAAGIPIEPVMEDTLKFGTVEVCEFAPAHSSDLSKFILDKMRLQAHALAKGSAGVLAPWHGLFVLGRDLDMAYDSFERIDGNAHIILMNSILLSASDRAGGLLARTAELRRGMAKYSTK
jgi:L-fuculose-phosphate aldolase